VKVISIAVLVSLGIGLGGCSNAPAAPQGHIFTSEGFVAVAPLGLFAEVAKASCDKAMAEGVVEKSTAADGFTLVMVPKDQGYRDFSAAYLNEPNDYQLIYETDAFSSCAAAMEFTLAEESGGAVDIDIEYDANDGSFVTTQDLGEFGINKLEYQTSGGLFVGVKTLDVPNSDPRTISYGFSEQDLQVLITAVDQFLATKQ
jgi:hypothetical protein